MSKPKATAKSLLKQAKSAISEGRFDDAVGLAQRAFFLCKKDSARFQCLVLRGAAQARNGEFEDAKTSLQDAADFSDEAGAITLTRAQLSLLQRRVEAGELEEHEARRERMQLTRKMLAVQFDTDAALSLCEFLLHDASEIGDKELGETQALLERIARECDIAFCVRAAVCASKRSAALEKRQFDQAKSSLAKRKRSVTQQDLNELRQQVQQHMWQHGAFTLEFDLLRRVNESEEAMPHAEQQRLLKLARHSDEAESLVLGMLRKDASFLPAVLYVCQFVQIDLTQEGGDKCNPEIAQIVESTTVNDVNVRMARAILSPSLEMKEFSNKGDSRLHQHFGAALARVAAEKNAARLASKAVKETLAMLKDRDLSDTQKQLKAHVETSGALLCMQQKRPQKALALCARAAETAPASVTLHRIRLEAASRLHREQRTDASAAELREACDFALQNCSNAWVQATAGAELALLDQSFESEVLEEQSDAVARYLCAKANDEATLSRAVELSESNAVKAEALALLAEAQLRSERRDQAKATAKQALKYASSNARAVHVLSKLLSVSEMQPLLDKAVRRVEKGRHDALQHGDARWALLRRAAFLLEQSSSDLDERKHEILRASHLCQMAVVHDSKDALSALAWHMLGIAYLRNNQISAAHSAFTKALERVPDSAELQFLLRCTVRLLHGDDENEEEEEELTHSKQLDRPTAFLLACTKLRRAQAAQDRGAHFVHDRFFRQARELLARSAGMKGDHVAEAVIALTQARASECGETRVIDQLRTCLAYDDLSQHVRRCLLHELGVVARDSESLQQALELPAQAEDHARTWLSLATCVTNKQQQLYCLEQAATLSEEGEASAWHSMFLLSLASQSSDFRAAAIRAEQLSEAKGDNAVLWLARGFLALDVCHLATAAAAFERSCELQSSRLGYLGILHCAMSVTSDFDFDLPYLKMIAERTLRQPSAHAYYLHAQVCLAMDELDEATRSVSSALDICGSDQEKRRLLQLLQLRVLLKQAKTDTSKLQEARAFAESLSIKHELSLEFALALAKEEPARLFAVVSELRQKQQRAKLAKEKIPLTLSLARVLTQTGKSSEALLELKKTVEELRELHSENVASRRLCEAWLVLALSVKAEEHVNEAEHLLKYPRPSLPGHTTYLRVLSEAQEVCGVNLFTKDQRSKFSVRLSTKLREVHRVKYLMDMRYILYDIHEALPIAEVILEKLTRNWSDEDRAREAFPLTEKERRASELGLEAAPKALNPQLAVQLQLFRNDREGAFEAVKAVSSKSKTDSLEHRFLRARLCASGTDAKPLYKLACGNIFQQQVNVFAAEGGHSDNERFFVETAALTVQAQLRLNEHYAKHDYEQRFDAERSATALLMMTGPADERSWHLLEHATKRKQAS